MSVEEIELPRADWEELRAAKMLLERPSLAARLTNAVGTPIEKGFSLLPDSWAGTVREAVHRSLNKALSVAVRTLPRSAGPSRERLHRAAVMATGATGGAFGLAGLIFELPVSTTLMLRSIAEIARNEEEDTSSIETQLACLEVFALGGRSASDDGAETGYFAIRSALAQAVSEAAQHLASRGLADKGAPALVRFLSAIGSRFGIVVSEKMAAMAVPVVGAASGALINNLFMNHFQDMARGHFTIRRLERKFGSGVIRKEYDRIQL